MSSERNQEAQEINSKEKKLETTQYLVETIRQLQAETENLKLQLRKTKGPPSGRISSSFLVPGVLFIAFSIVGNSQVLAFLGLTLVFWGALFLFARPVKYVKGSLLDSTAVASYTTIDRIVKDLKFSERGYYIPPYPKDVYLPDHLKGLKEMIVFISADSGRQMPTIEEMAKSRFLLGSPNGICVAPPGLGLLSQLEKELRKDATKMKLDEISEDLPRVIVQSFQLAKDVEIRPENGEVRLRMVGSIYKNLYTRIERLNSVHFLGCPLVSAVCCALAKSQGKIVTISEDKFSPDGETIDVLYQFVEG